MRSPQELLRAAYKAFNARDIDTVLGLMHPDVDWPNGMEGGRVHGHPAVRDYWTRQWAMIDPHVEPLRFEEEDGQVIVHVHQVVRDLAGNILLDQPIQHIYSIHQGRIDRMDIQQPETTMSNGVTPG